MKKSFLIFFALAASAGAVGRATMSEDEQWACEIALCMANPNGPTAAPACKPPIEKMLREQAKGNSIPSCKFIARETGDISGGSGGGKSDSGDIAQQAK